MEGMPIMKSLIARQGDTLYISIGYGSNPRPTDVADGLTFTYDAAESADTTTDSDGSPDLAPGKAPAGFKMYGMLAYYITTANGYDVRWAAYTTFSDGSVTKDPTPVFSEGIDSAKQNYPKNWGKWKEEDGYLYIDWDGNSDTFRKYDVSNKASPGGKDERLSKCFSSFTVYAISDSNFAALSKEWCFNKNGRFSNDSAVSISTEEGSGSSNDADKTGRYRIDGHVIQLTYDNGNKPTTTFGLVENWADDGTTLLLLGGSRYEN